MALLVQYYLPGAVGFLLCLTVGGLSASVSFDASIMSSHTESVVEDLLSYLESIQDQSADNVIFLRPSQLRQLFHWRPVDEGELFHKFSNPMLESLTSREGLNALTSNVNPLMHVMQVGRRVKDALEAVQGIVLSLPIFGSRNVLEIARSR